MQVTTHFVGDHVELSDNLLAARQAAAAVIAAPFELTFDQVKTFPASPYA